MKKILALLVVVLLAVALVGCGSREVNEDNLEGTWEVRDVHMLTYTLVAGVEQDRVSIQVLRNGNITDAFINHVISEEFGEDHGLTNAELDEIRAEIRAEFANNFNLRIIFEGNTQTSQMYANGTWRTVDVEEFEIVEGNIVLDGGDHEVIVNNLTNNRLEVSTRDEWREGNRTYVNVSTMTLRRV
jgi:hypothetical protein